MRNCGILSVALFALGCLVYDLQAARRGFSQGTFTEVVNQVGLELLRGDGYGAALIQTPRAERRYGLSQRREAMRSWSATSIPGSSGFLVSIGSHLRLLLALGDALDFVPWGNKRCP